MNSLDSSQLRAKIDLAQGSGGMELCGVSLSEAGFSDRAVTGAVHSLDIDYIIVSLSGGPFILQILFEHHPNAPKVIVHSHADYLP